MNKTTGMPHLKTSGTVNTYLLT